MNSRDTINAKTLVAVSGYAGDQHQIENNLPLYQHHKCPLLILSPSDAPIASLEGGDKAIQYRHAGEKGWIGKHTLERQRLFLKILLEYHYDWYLFHDSDSVCLRPVIPEYLYRSAGVFWSNEVLDTNPSPSLLPKIAMQPPYFFHRSVLQSIYRSSATPALSFTRRPNRHGQLPPPTDCIDHFMLQIVYAANVPHKSFPDGSSFETTSEHGLNTMVHHVKKQGKIFIHQVKTKEVLQTLRAAL